jgi:hypothetical protein
LPAHETKYHLLQDEPQDQETQGEGRPFNQNPQKQAERKEPDQLDKKGEHEFQIRENDRDFIKVGINQSQDHRNGKNKYGGYQGKSDHGQKFGEDKFFFRQPVDQILFDGLVAVFIRHHGNDYNSKKKLKKGCDKGVEMPDIGEIENPLIRQMKFNGPDIELNGRDQGDGSQEHKIGDDQKPTRPIVP